MERSYGGSELGFKSLTFSPFIITCHSLGMGFTTDGEGREERVWLAINLSKLEMSRPTQPRQGAGGALISPLSRPLSLYSLHLPLLHLSRCLVRPPHLDTSTQPVCGQLNRSLAKSQTLWSFACQLSVKVSLHPNYIKKIFSHLPLTAVSICADNLITGTDHKARKRN